MALKRYEAENDKSFKLKCIKSRYCKVFTFYRVVRGILITHNVCLVDDLIWGWDVMKLNGNENDDCPRT